MIDISVREKELIKNILKQIDSGATIALFDGNMGNNLTEYEQNLLADILREYTQ